MSKQAFADASFYIALANPRDQYHEQAVERAIDLEKENVHLVITRAILLEIGDALANPRYRKAVAVLLESLEKDPRVEIIPLSEQLYHRAFELFKQRPDKAWGLVDCISFIVMQDRGITDALTADDHFRQAGFIPLLSDR